MTAATATWHLALVVQFAVILFVGGYLQHGYRNSIRLMSRRLYWMGYAYGAALLFVAIAVTVNLATSTHPSPGARLLCVLLMPVTAFSVLVIVRTLLERRS